MASINKAKRFTEKTHEGAPAARMTPLQALKRSTMSCLLWEREFYEDGQDIATRIGALVPTVDPASVAQLCIDLRNSGHLRHVPLLLLCHLAISSRGTSLMRETVPQVVKRADELAELAAIWWKLHPDKHIPHNMEKGLRDAFKNFNEYHFAKYDRDGDVKLRDVLRLVHAKPASAERAALYKRINERTLATPDTWEVELSASTDKKYSWLRLLREKRLGGLAMLRNLRNMVQAGVEHDIISRQLITNEYARVLPFRFVAAARIMPQFEKELDVLLTTKIDSTEKFDGDTVALVDVSGSMDAPLSARSDLTRMDAAATLASIINAERLRVFTFSNALAEVPARRGMAGVDAVIRSQHHGGTALGGALAKLSQIVTKPPKRLIVITDEQSHDAVSAPLDVQYRYMVNVASAKNGVGYGPWTHVDGFSENIIRFMHANEERHD